MFDSPFPDDIAFGCSAVLDDHISDLDPSERALLSQNVSPKRLAEFASGRFLARNILRQLAISPIPPILKGEGGEPIWPAEVIGALAHGAGYVVAAATKQDKICGIGVDIESLHRHFKSKVAEYVASPRELAWIREEPDQQRQRTLMLFSAKESFYKATYPHLQKSFGFKSVVLSKIDNASLFTLEPIEPFLIDWLSDKSLSIGYTICQEKILSWTLIRRLD